MGKMINQLIEHEGMRGKFYLCTSDKKSIGIGRNVDARPFTSEELIYLGRSVFDTNPMTLIEAKWLLVNDVDGCELKLLSSGVIHGLSELGEARRAVCINMVYNMGITGFCRFKKMIKAINDRRFDRAAIEMMDSRWAKQVGNRAVQLSAQMALGEFDDG